MDVSRAVGIRRIQVLCSTPSERGEIALQSLQKKGHEPWEFCPTSPCENLSRLAILLYTKEIAKTLQEVSGKIVEARYLENGAKLLFYFFTAI